MKYKIFVLIILFTCSCKSMPAIQSFNQTSDKFDQKLCSHLFSEGKWQFIHSIESTMPNQKKTFILGITNISSRDKKIRVLMMTIEGLVLFDAEYDQELKINKSIPPFDSNEFASGLIGDIKLIFIKPDGEIVQSGYLKDGSRICRYRDNKGFVIDTNFNQDNTWAIRKYTRNNRLIRMVQTVSILEKQSKHKTFLPQKIELIAYGKHKYSLRMDLIEAKQISD
ncbi:MAG: hypothetical protein JRJ76_00805 [Deltaproteobacteria bacterium]|nr:hypothetical protein [Deltaproteobacteria bacterium]